MRGYAGKIFPFSYYSSRFVGDMSKSFSRQRPVSELRRVVGKYHFGLLIEEEAKQAPWLGQAEKQSFFVIRPHWLFENRIPKVANRIGVYLDEADRLGMEAEAP